MSHQSRPTPLRTLFNLFSASLQEYEEQTGIALSKHPLAEQLRHSDSPESVIAILQEQVPKSGRTDRITKLLSSVVSVLYTFPPFPLARPIYAGFGILLATVKDVSALDPLVDLLESIGSCLKHIDICTKVLHITTMTETLVKTLVELLSTLGLVTKLIKQRQPGTFVERISGGNYNWMVLERLDRLTPDEVQTTASQVLEVVYGLVQNMRVIVDGGKSSIAGILGALESIHHIVSDANKLKRDKWQQDIRGWLLPPDPSINHKIACELRHTGTTAWFVQGDTFSEWKWSKTSPLLWIRGKPGAGKSILCSAIIQDIDIMKRAGLVSLAYFYCDFRDDEKNDIRGLVSSLLVQLCHQSDSYCDMFSKFYLEHPKGSRSPSNAALISFLEGLLKLPGQAPLYLIVDALDECPTASDMPPALEKVLILVKQHMASKYPNLHICVSSQLGPDLSLVLEPLSFHFISLHDQSGQKEDISGYIKFVVNTDPKMQAWRSGDKELVIDVLTNTVDGVFQWASCQLAYLRHCPRERIKRTLDDLPDTLDATYRRTLRDIDKADRTFAQRLFSFVFVARRPLRVEELAELVAFGPNGRPFRLFRKNWSQEDLLNAVQTTYSSLLAIVKNEDATIIQISHFSVQEFFENSILTNANPDVSYYHFPMVSTHTLVAHACLDVLLSLDKSVVVGNSHRRFPLAKYAAKHWFDHVQFGNLWEDVEDKVKRLFDPGSLHLALCLWIHLPKGLTWVGPKRTEWPLPIAGTTLHYAALWGLHTIVKFLIIERSQDVQALGFTNMATPLHLAAKGGHVEAARFLLECGADVTARDKDMETPLHMALRGGQSKFARFLIDHGADVNSQDIYGFSPLHHASREGQLEAARFLIDHGADVNAREKYSLTPLDLASRKGRPEVARFLIDHGADVNVRGMDSFKPLNLALRDGQWEIARFLIDQGVDVNAHNTDSFTLLHLSLQDGQLEIAQFLVDRGADVNARDKYSYTPLHLASKKGQLVVARFLIDNCADVNARYKDGFTPLHLASREGQPHIAGILLKRGADVDARDNDNCTPLHLASQQGDLKVALILIEQGTDVNARDHSNWTPLHGASQAGYLDMVHLLLSHGADPHASDHGGWTPLQLPSHNGNLEIVRALLKHGANANARDNSHWTPLHGASQLRHWDVVQVLIEHGADVDSRDDSNRTPLDVAVRAGYPQLVPLLV